MSTLREIVTHVESECMPAHFVRSLQNGCLKWSGNEVGQLCGFVDRQPELGCVGCFQRSAIVFAVALHGVAVSCLEETAFYLQGSRVQLI